MRTRIVYEESHCGMSLLALILKLWETEFLSLKRNPLFGMCPAPDLSIPGEEKAGEQIFGNNPESLEQLSCGQLEGDETFRTRSSRLPVT